MAKSKDKVAINKVTQVRGFGSLEIKIDDPSGDVCWSRYLYLLLSQGHYFAGKIRLWRNYFLYHQCFSWCSSKYTSCRCCCSYEVSSIRWQRYRHRFWCNEDLCRFFMIQGSRSMDSRWWNSDYFHRFRFWIICVTSWRLRWDKTYWRWRSNHVIDSCHRLNLRFLLKRQTHRIHLNQLDETLDCFIKIHQYMNFHLHGSEHFDDYDAAVHFEDEFVLSSVFWRYLDFVLLAYYRDKNSLSNANVHLCLCIFNF